MTTYTVFTHYYNDSIGKAVSNSNQCKWHSALEDKYKGQALGHYIDITDIDQDLKKKDQETVEIIHISSQNPDTAETTGDYETYILDSTKVSNPKYDMLFVYDGLGYFYYREQKQKGANADSDYAQKTQLYFDKMKRVNIKPWFFHSTYHSLRAAMSKAENLVDLFGKENILVGKEVDLTQYIDIV